MFKTKVVNASIKNSVRDNIDLDTVVPSGPPPDEDTQTLVQEQELLLGLHHLGSLLSQLEHSLHDVDVTVT